MGKAAAERQQQPRQDAGQDPCGFPHRLGDLRVARDRFQKGEGGTRCRSPEAKGGSFHSHTAPFR